MLIIAIVLLILVSLYVIFGSIWQKKLLINKGVIIITVIAIGLIFFSARFGGNDDKQQVEYYQEIAPPITQAPYMLQTPSRAYYIATFDDTESHMVLTYFYFYDKGKKWTSTNMSLFLDKTLPEYSDLKILKRWG